MVICVIVVVRLFRRRRDTPTETPNQCYNLPNTKNESVYETISIDQIYDGNIGNLKKWSREGHDSHDGRPPSNLVGISCPRYANDVELDGQFTSTVVEPSSCSVGDGGYYNAGVVLTDEVPSSSGNDATPRNDRCNSMEISKSFQSWV